MVASSASGVLIPQILIFAGMRSVGVLDQPHQRAVGIDQVADPQAARLQLRSFEARPAGAFFLGSRRVHQCHHGIEIIQPQATAERARSWVEVRIGEEFELQTAALQEHPAAILPTRRKAQLRIKRLCHIEIARWQIGGDVVSHGSAQLVGHAGRMSDCGAAIGGGMAHHDHAGLGERRTKRAR